MTEALSTLFEGHEIRVLEQDNDLWFPLTDIAKAWGLKINTLYQILNRNKAKFTDRVSDVHVTSTTSEDESYHKSVDEQGLYLLLGAINTDRLKKRDVAMVILRFQRWVPELIQKYRKNEIVQVVCIDHELEQAKHYAELTQHDVKVFQAAIFRKYNMPEFAEALQSQIPAIVHGETGWYNITQLCEMCHDDALAGHPERLNNYLKNHGYQYKEQGLWRLNPNGEVHGKEYRYEAPSGHQEIRIRWRESILYSSGILKEG